MKYTIKESQLHDIIAKCVKESINEGFWDNVGSAVRGAYNGYKANTSRQNQQSHETRTIATRVNDLYELVGSLASDFNKNGEGLYNARSYQTIEEIKKIVGYIESSFMKSQSYQNRANRETAKRQQMDNF